MFNPEALTPHMGVCIEMPGTLFLKLSLAPCMGICIEVNKSKHVGVLKIKKIFNNFLKKGLTNLNKCVIL